MRGPTPRPLPWLSLALLVMTAGCASRAASRSTEGWPAELQGPGEAALPLPTEAPASPAHATAAPAAGACSALKGPSSLERAAVVRAVDRGLGRWLGGVAVSPVKEGGRFRGWRLDRLHPDDPCYQQIDLRPGDVITRVNGSTLERPEQANQVWEGLRGARQLQVERVRDGAARTLTYEIVD